MSSGLHSDTVFCSLSSNGGLTHGCKERCTLTLTAVHGILRVTTWHAGRELLIVLRERRDYNTIAVL